MKKHYDPIDSADAYQMKALRTAVMPEHELVKRFRELGDDAAAERLHRLLGIFNRALGLAGEAGEVCDLLKKHFFHGKALDTDELKKELGDVRWYETVLANDFNIKESDVQGTNEGKLRERFPQGFSFEASAARVDTKNVSEQA